MKGREEGGTEAGKEGGVNVAFCMMWMREKDTGGELNKLVCSPLLHMAPKLSEPKGIEAKFCFVR